jgi:hypothetical protein
MAKAFLLAKSFYRYCTPIIRDHGTSRNLAGWIPAGVFTPAAGRQGVGQSRFCWS